MHCGETRMTKESNIDALAVHEYWVFKIKHPELFDNKGKYTGVK